jgi:hypothetical protein
MGTLLSHHLLVGTAETEVEDRYGVFAWGSHTLGHSDGGGGHLRMVNHKAVEHRHMKTPLFFDDYSLKEIFFMQARYDTPILRKKRWSRRI